MLSILYLILTSVGVLSSLIQTIFCAIIIKNYVLKKSSGNQLQFHLLFLRVVLDFLNGLINTIYFLLTIPSLTEPDFPPFHYLFFFALLASNMQESRGFLAAGIAVERTFATFYPIAFYKYRSKLPNIVLVLFFVLLGIIPDFVLFGVCRAYPIDPECKTFVCATTECWQAYATTTKLIFSSLNLAFSILLCIKFMQLNIAKWSTTSELKRANLICLSDGLLTIVFELLPPAVMVYFSIDISAHGPVSGALRSCGRSFEALIMYYLLKPETPSRNRTSPQRPG